MARMQSDVSSSASHGAVVSTALQYAVEYSTVLYSRINAGTLPIIMVLLIAARAHPPVRLRVKQRIVGGGLGILQKRKTLLEMLRFHVAFPIGLRVVTPSDNGFSLSCG